MKHISLTGAKRFRNIYIKLFQWELHLLLVLWGREWDDDEIIDQHQALIAAAQKVNHDFAGWGIAQATSRAMFTGVEYRWRFTYSDCPEIGFNFS